MSTARTVRTYGRRQTAATPSSPPGLVFAPSSSSSVLFTPPSSPLSKPRRQLSHSDDDGDAESDRAPLHPPSSPTLKVRKNRHHGPLPTVTPLSRNWNPPEAQAEAQAKRKARGTLNDFFTPLKRSRASETGPTRPLPPSTSSARRVSESAPTTRPTRMHQLQFMTNAVHTCPECCMSYLRGTDEADHKRHHARVTRGIPWKGRKEARIVNDRLPLDGAIKAEPKKEDGLDEEATDTHASFPPITLVASTSKGRSLALMSAPSTRPSPRQYRILMLDASTPGVLVSDILRTVDTVLSAPALPPPILTRCKLFLAVTACEPLLPRGAKPRPGPKPKDGGTQRVVGVVVSQPIKWAMRVLREGEQGGQVVDSGDGVICDPTSLPTPLGIHRLFIVPAYRGCGLATALLDAAASQTVYGCTFDPKKGEIAFSQPTESGKRVMEKWGAGGIRVFVDDEGQL